MGLPQRHSIHRRHDEYADDEHAKQPTDDATAPAEADAAKTATGPVPDLLKPDAITRFDVAHIKLWNSFV